ncbi:MAG: STAS domain-containing protein [Myxococcales bacterium]|nr:STAS domain-containing protein [Myxococcales bacterium]
MSSRASFGRREGTALVVLRGQVRYPEARALRRFVDEVVLPAGCDTVFIDVSSVDAIDSTGMGLLARIGRATVEKHGRRAILVGPGRDVAPCLRAAAFDSLFHLVDAFPYEPQVEVHEVPLVPEPGPPLARVMLDAHQTLAELAERNRAAFADVISVLDEEVKRDERH